MRPVPYSLEVGRRSGSNFTASFVFLPREQRRGLWVVYAFCRLVDDAVDEASDPVRARQEIARWRELLESCYGVNGDPAGPLQPPALLPELREAVRQFEIPQAYFSDLLCGVEMDIEKRRYDTFEDLARYCYHVAGTIGLLCNQIFGRRDPLGREYALTLGTAFQLTNILRDVGSDGRRGRIYLPQEDLRRFGVSEEELLVGHPSPAFRDLMSFEAVRAGEFFEAAERILPEAERRKLVAAEMMTAVYRRLLEKLVRLRFPVFTGKVRLGSFEKIILLAKAYLRSWL